MENNLLQGQDKQFVSELKEIVNESRRVAYNAVNYALIRRNGLLVRELLSMNKVAMPEQNMENMLLNWHLNL